MGYIYKRLKKVNIKAQDSFSNAINKVIEQKINVKYNFENCFSEKSGTLKPKNLEIISYFKNIRKNYIINPEIIFLMNLFSRIKKVIIDINIFSKENDAKKKIYELILYIASCKMNSEIFDKYNEYIMIYLFD